MALQALAKYATLTYGKSGDLAVTVTAPTGSKQDFMLEASNRLVLQRAALLPSTDCVPGHRFCASELQQEAVPKRHIPIVCLFTPVQMETLLERC